MIPTGNIKIVGRNIDISSEIKSYINEKLDKLSQYEQKISSVEVTIEKEKFVYLINVLLHTYNKKIIKISAKDKSLLSGIDIVIDKLKDVMVKYKEKKVSSKKHNKEILKDFFNTPQVYIKNQLVIKKLSEQDVIKELLNKKEDDTEPIIFFNTDTNKISVAKKSGGNIEILDVDIYSGS
jgi:putative sigma-54 modulation protein